MLDIDRMWDAVSLHDVRFLAYPFLFYIDPYRSIFSGTLLHFFGPNRILLRLPSILFSIGTYWFLVYVFIKEKINPWIIALSLLAFTVSGITINDRSGGGDAQTRFFILVAGYYLWQAFRYTVLRNVQFALLAWTFGLLTMLDAVVLFPALVYAFWKRQGVKHKKTLILAGGIAFLLTCYFTLWIVLPYIAFKDGYQHYLSNRGLFYYFSVAKSGSTRDSFSSINWFIHYTSIFFVLWTGGTAIATFWIKKLRILQLITIPAWIAILLLRDASFHVIMYAGLFLLQAMLVTNYFLEKFPKTKYIIIFFLSAVAIANAYNLFTQYSDVYQFNPHRKTMPHKTAHCLDESVIRIYQIHHSYPLNKSCTYPRVQ